MKKYFSFVKIEHTVFSLPVIYAGMMLAALANVRSGIRLPDTTELVRIALLVLLAATGARTVGFALNRIIDRKIDAKNPRTSMRDLPSGKMNLNQAYIVLAGGLIAYMIAAYSINWLCLALSPIPLLVFLLYPYMKRFTRFAHFGVGLSLGLGPLGGYFALRPVIDEYIIPVALLTVFTWLWVSGFDIIYATSDEEFDKREGLFSFPSVYGKKKALRYSLVTHGVAYLFLISLYLTAFPGSIIGIVLLVVAGILLVLENKKADDVELAFFHINTVVGFVIFFFVFFPVYGQL
jgi:4-hydroxybenzoate polyprenyltransferase